MNNQTNIKRNPFKNINTIGKNLKILINTICIESYLGPDVPRPHSLTSQVSHTNGAHSQCRRENSRDRGKWRPFRNHKRLTVKNEPTDGPSGRRLTGLFMQLIFAGLLACQNNLDLREGPEGFGARSLPTIPGSAKGAYVHLKSREEKILD